MSLSTLAPIGRALLSVSDKTGLLSLAQALQARGVELVSTGGTAAALKDAGIAVRQVSEITHFPEMMDGRIKTLHPKIHGGLLARRSNALHREAMEKHHIPAIDLLVVNLYPFAQTVAEGKSWNACVEQIDIGGPAMIRAAAKNYHDVAVLTSPGQYDRLLHLLEDTDGRTDIEQRQQWALEAFAHTASYDAMIAAAFAREQGEVFPAVHAAAYQRAQVLRYGENPHQQAALYLNPHAQRPGAPTATQKQGKPLSYNNINDTDAAFELVAEFTDRPAVAIVKHANPCGVALGQTPAEAFRKALACDPTSAYGGIVACNREISKELATELSSIFLEVVIAPSISHEAEVILATRKNLRLLLTGCMPDPKQQQPMLRSVAGGVLVQEGDAQTVEEKHLRPVTTRAPSAKEKADLLFAFTVAKHVKSNAIVYAKDGATVAIGAGQMSRLDAARIAIQKAQDTASSSGSMISPIKGAVVASDAFFPFADGLLAAASAGVTAVIQPGGSIRDDEVIQAANNHDLAMLFTGVRHFRH